MEQVNLEQVYEWGKKTREISPREIPQNIRNAQLGILPEGMQVVDLSNFLPERPKRKQVNLSLTSVDSFVQYVNEQKNENTRIFGSISGEPYSFRAIIDYHGINGQQPDWCEHTVNVELALSEQFRTWRKISDGLMNQSDFVEFLKDNRLDIIQPDNGQILTLCMELDAHAESRCTSKVPTNNGMAFSFVEDIQTTRNGEKVEVPSSILLNIPVFEGTEPVQIECDFKFRLAGGTMAFGIRMLGVEKMIRDAVNLARAEIESKVGVPVYV